MKHWDDIKKKDGTPVRFSRFESIDQLIDLCERTQDEKFNISPASFMKDADPFFGGISPEKATHFLKNGWAEGLKLAAPLMLEIQDKIRNRVLVCRPEYSVAGGVPDIPCFLASDPECFIGRRYEERQGNGALVRVRVQLGAAARISNETMLLRGIAVIALVQALEMAGKSIQIDVIASLRLSCPDSQVEVRLKKFGAPLEMDRLAFCIGHPAFYRRWMFHYSRSLEINSDDLGFPTQDFFAEDGDISTPNLYGNFSAEGAAQYVLDNLKKQGVLLD